MHLFSIKYTYYNLKFIHCHEIILVIVNNITSYQFIFIYYHLLNNFIQYLETQYFGMKRHVIFYRF